MAMKTLEYLRGISPDDGRKLRERGILNTNQLLHATMLDIDRFAERISKLTPQEKQQLAGLLAGDRTLVDAIVRRSPAKQQIDMLNGCTPQDCSRALG